MLPQRKNEISENGDRRSGFQVHVIGGGATVPAGGGASGLEIGLRIGAGMPAERAAGEAPSVLRLEPGAEVEPPRARPMSEAGPGDPSVTLARRRKGLGVSQWTGWMSVASCVLAVAAVVGLLVRGKSAPQAADAAANFVFEEESRLDAGQEYFMANSGRLIAEAEALLERYAGATSVEQALRRVRDAERVKERMHRLWRPWGGTTLALGEAAQGEVETGERPSIRLSGRRGDFTPFVLSFVREGERLVLDWEASFGIGEVQIPELRAGAAAEGALVRAIVRPDAYYTRDFPEDSFRSYLLLGADGETSVWAYAPRNSSAAAALAETFNEGSVLLEAGSDTRATLRVSGPSEAGGKSFVITEMLHKGWVTP
jgi:hypothetical protein